VCAPGHVPGSAAEHVGEQVIEEEALDEPAAATHADLLEGVLDVPLDRVLGDEDAARDLARGQPSYNWPRTLSVMGSALLTPAMLQAAFSPA